jgi:Mrp family chromosome partitioning ATPase
MRDLLDELAKRDTIVVLDSPSLRPATDAAVLSNFADVTLLIVRPGKTRRDSLEASAEALRQAGGRVLGVVMNRVSSRQQ